MAPEFHSLTHSLTHSPKPSLQAVGGCFGGGIRSLASLLSYSRLIIIVISASFFAACGTPSKVIPDLSPDNKQENGKPDWYWKPGAAGKIGGVGICGPHINGLTGQRELAVSRAIDDIARQMGVKVDSAVQMATSGTKDSAVTQADVYSIQTVDGKTVKAAVRELWEDPKTGELYVWMVIQ